MKILNFGPELHCPIRSLPAIWTERHGRVSDPRARAPHEAWTLTAPTTRPWHRGARPPPRQGDADLKDTVWKPGRGCRQENARFSFCLNSRTNASGRALAGGDLAHSHTHALARGDVGARGASRAERGSCDRNRAAHKVRNYLLSRPLRKMCVDPWSTVTADEPDPNPACCDFHRTLTRWERSKSRKIFPNQNGDHGRRQLAPFTAEELIKGRAAPPLVCKHFWL